MGAERLSMRTVQEILRLKWGCGLTNRQIGRRCGVARSTVAEGWASATYVASGWRSAMAHGPASPNASPNAPVLRARAQGMVGRRSRRTPARHPAASALRAYVAAQQAGIAAARPGAPLMGIDAAMACVLEERGFGGAFLRPVFHGIGIEHEEAPIPGGHAVIHGEEKVEQVEAGMVLGIGDCGIYREDFGARVEDAVWVSDDGPISLTSYPMALIG